MSNLSLTEIVLKAFLDLSSQVICALSFTCCVYQ